MEILHYRTAGTRLSKLYLMYATFRKIFTLPSVSLITKWTASVDAEPGFMKEVLDALNLFEDQDRDVNLVIDGMSIKKAKIWNNSLGKFIGFPDYGNITAPNSANDEHDVLATEALVIMAVCLRGTWKLPIAYFFQNRITGSNNRKKSITHLKRQLLKNNKSENFASELALSLQ